MIVMEALESLERLLKIERKPASNEDKSEIEELAERLMFISLVHVHVYTMYIPPLCRLIMCPWVNQQRTVLLYSICVNVILPCISHVT